VKRQSRTGWRKCQLGAVAFAAAILLIGGCSVNQPELEEAHTPEGSGQDDETTQVSEALVANVISVQVTGAPNAYQFSVGVSSPDEGCEQYADWWEVFTEDGELVYRRILAHSHVDEQPFVRSGGPVGIGPDTVVFIRAHMHPGGYGGSVMRGTVNGGFETVELEADFATELEREPPQPTGCAF
jgi:hypothetical protein